MDTAELLEKIQALEEENAKLREWQGDINKLLGQILGLLETQKTSEESLRTQLATVYQNVKINRYRIDSLPYEMAAADYKVDISFPHIIDEHETRRLLAADHKSIARLGDGEFAAIVGDSRWNFQEPSKELGQRMKEVLSSRNDRLLIGLNPNFYRSLLGMQEDEADGVRAYMRPMVRRLHDSLLDGRTYADGLFHNINGEGDVKELKEIWNGRNVTIIEGEYTRMGVGNDLLDNATGIKRILAPSENAFSVYDRLLEEALKIDKENLVLVALGPTATILAYDLCNEGYQAIDIGHMDLIYEKYLRGLDSLYDVKIPYKYCNSDEIGDRRQIENIDDSDYKNQIITRIVQ